MNESLYSKKAKLFILFSIVISISASIYYKFFDNHPPRYCDEKKRVLTNEELIIAALENRYKYNLIKIDDSTKTAQDFYRKYPNCCKVGRTPPLIKKNLWGDLYDENQGHIEMILFYPTSEERLARPIRVFDGTDPEGHLRYLDKTLAYSKDTFQMSVCGGVGDTVEEKLNIKDTPFAKNLNK